VLSTQYAKGGSPTAPFAQISISLTQKGASHKKKEPKIKKKVKNEVIRRRADFGDAWREHYAELPLREIWDDPDRMDLGAYLEQIRAEAAEV
jgi:hypothetical protein